MRRLPRLPRDVAIIDRAIYPALKFQQWWQRVVEAIEGMSAGRSVASDGPITEADRFLLADASAGPVTLTLPPVSDNAGAIYSVKKVDASANAVTIAGNNGELIDGSAIQTLAAQYDALTVYCDGVDWFIV